MSASRDDIHLAGARFEHHRHVCAFFHTRDEEYEVLMPFIKEGIERGEKAFHVVDPSLQTEHHHRLGSAGINFDDLLNKNQLEVRVWENAYLRKEKFDQFAMLDLIEEILSSGKRDGFPLTRLVAHMEWSLENKPGVDDIMEYEARLNYILPRYEDPVICVYDLSRFTAGTIIDILRTHPMVLIGRTLQVNPFYVSPDELIKEFDARKQQ